MWECWQVREDCDVSGDLVQNRSTGYAFEHQQRGNLRGFPAGTDTWPMSSTLWARGGSRPFQAKLVAVIWHNRHKIVLPCVLVNAVRFPKYSQGRSLEPPEGVGPTMRKVWCHVLLVMGVMRARSMNGRKVCNPCLAALDASPQLPSILVVIFGGSMQRLG